MTGRAAAVVTWEQGRGDRTVFMLRVRDVAAALTTPVELEDDERDHALSRLQRGGIVDLTRREINGLIGSGHLLLTGDD